MKGRQTNSRKKREKRSERPPQVDALADLPMTGEQAEDAKAGVCDGDAQERLTIKFMTYCSAH